jgi:hypothetical protein
MVVENWVTNKNIDKKEEKIPIKIDFYDTNNKLLDSLLVNDENTIVYSKSSIFKDFDELDGINVSIDFSKIPKNTDYYKVSLQKDYNNINCYDEIYNKVTDVIFAINVAIDSTAVMESDEIDGDRYYAETDSIKDYAIIPRFKNIKTKYNNGFLLGNGVQVLFNKINHNCNYQPQTGIATKVDACAELIVDINGNDAPNKFSNYYELNDRFKFLLYADGVIPEYNSIEQFILANREIKAIINPELNKTITTCLKNNYDTFFNNIQLQETKVSLWVPYMNAKEDVKVKLLLKFYNEDDKLIDTIEKFKTFNGEMGTIGIDINFNELNNDITSYSVEVFEQ